MEQEEVKMVQEENPILQDVIRVVQEAAGVVIAPDAAVNEVSSEVESRH